MKTIEKIRQKIEELYEGEAPAHDQQCEFEDGYFTGIAAISKFLDTLEEKSEIPTNLDELLDDYFEKLVVPEHQIIFENTYRKIATDFYRMGQGASEKPNNHEGLDEAAEKYAGYDQDCEGAFYEPMIIQAFKAGAEWDRWQGRTFEMDFDGYHSIELTLDKYVLQGIGICPHDKVIVQIRKKN